jgi:4-amino-4-deoxy-L-arabinose transferase-like glycosyltransferase
MADDRPTPRGRTRLAANPVRRRRWFAAAAAVAAVVYLGSVTGRWWPTADSAVYLGLGDSLARGEGYVFNGRVWTQYTPGLPAALAGLRAGFGRGHFAANLLIAASGLAALAMAYAALRMTAGRTVARVAAVCTAFTFVFWYNAHRVLTDVPFALLFWAAAWAALKARGGGAGWLVAALALAAAAVTVRAPGALVLGPFAVGLASDRPPRRGRRRYVLTALAIVAAAAATLGGFYLLARWQAARSPMYARFVSGAAATPAAGLVGRVLRGLAALPEALEAMCASQSNLYAVAPLLMALMGVGGWRLWRRGRRGPAVTVVLTVLALALAAGPTGIDPRYLLPVLPLMLALTVCGLQWVVAAAVRRLRGRAVRSAYVGAALGLAAAAVAANAPKLARNAVYYTYLARTPRYYDVIADGWHAERLAMAERLARARHEPVLVAAAPKDAYIFHYVSGCPVTMYSRDLMTGRAGAAEALESLAAAEPRVGAVLVSMRLVPRGRRGAMDEAIARSGSWRELHRTARLRLLVRADGGRVTAGRPGGR